MIGWEGSSTSTSYSPPDAVLERLGFAHPTPPPSLLKAVLNTYELFTEYSELPECVLPDDQRSGETAARLGEMLQRHGRSTCGALDAMIKRYSRGLAT